MSYKQNAVRNSMSIHGTGIKTAYLHIAFLSVIILLRALFASGLPPYFAYPDTETYELLALEAYNGLPPSLPVRPLGYPLFIALIFKLFGPGLEFVAYAQQLIGIASYFLYYLLMRRFFKRPAASASVAFITSISGAFLLYEKMALSDFMNHFLLLLGITLYVRAYDDKDIPLLALSGIASAAAVTIRQNSLIIPVMAVSFLLLQLLYERGGGNVKKTLKGTFVYASAVVILLVGFNAATSWAIGFKGSPVGVLGITVFSRVAGHIEYANEPHREIKERYNAIRHEYNGRYDQFTADALAGYRLMTEIKCEMPEEEKQTYQRAAESAERFYGAHMVGSNYFTTYDLLRELNCDIKNIEATLYSISLEAVRSDTAGFLKSIALNLIDYIAAGVSQYYEELLREKNAGRSVSTAVMKIYAHIGQFFEGVYVTVALIILFISGAVCFFIEAQKKDRLIITFLLAFLIANYLLLALMWNVLVPRYKLPAYWIEIFLFFYFSSFLLNRIFSIIRRRA